VWEDGGVVFGTYFLRANQEGGGAHVANCGYITARAMCLDSLELAKLRGFRTMQFNFVVSTNQRAVKLWRDLGFKIAGCLPGAFRHPDHGLVDALVMYIELC
jgi:hypothetical protein